MADELLAGRYRRIAALGHGALGEMWLAEDIGGHRQVAIRRLPAGADGLASRARDAVRLAHPNLLAVLDVPAVEGSTYIVTEHVAGVSLADRLRADRRLPGREAAQLIGQAAAALDVGHRAGVAHGGVQPAGIVVTPEGVAKLADFATGWASRDPAYVAPDAAGAGGPTPAGDIWSLGATLFAAVEGAFSLAEAPRFAGDLTPLLAAMLATDPAQRPGAAEVSQWLGEFAAGGPAGTAQAPPEATVRRTSLVAPDPPAVVAPASAPSAVPAAESTQVRWSTPALSAVPWSAPRLSGRPADPPPQLPAPTGRRSRRTPVLAALVALVLIAGAGVAGYFAGGAGGGNAAAATSTPTVTITASGPRPRTHTRTVVRTRTRTRVRIVAAPVVVHAPDAAKDATKRADIRRVAARYFNLRLSVTVTLAAHRDPHGRIEILFGVPGVRGHPKCKYTASRFGAADVLILHGGTWGLYRARPRECTSKLVHVTSYHGTRTGSSYRVALPVADLVPAKSLRVYAETANAKLRTQDLAPRDGKHPLVIEVRR